MLHAPSLYPLLIDFGELVKQDKQPRVIPVWPVSRRMTLVVAIVEEFENADEGKEEMYVLTEPSQADELVDFNSGLSQTAVLFFSVTRKWAMENCEKLTVESWN